MRRYSCIPSLVLTKQFLFVIVGRNATYTAQKNYSSNSGPWSLAVVDVNSDGKVDIIVGNYDSNTVGVFLNTGNGTFSLQTTYSTGISPWSLVATDVNNDSKPDIIVTNSGSDNVGVLLAY